MATPAYRWNAWKTTPTASRVALAGRRVKERPGQVRHEVGPAKQPQDLHRRRQHPERGGQRHHSEVILRQDLTHEDDDRGEGQGGEDKGVPGKFQPGAAGLKAAQDVPGRPPEDGGVVEAAAEHEEANVEGDWH